MAKNSFVVEVTFKTFDYGIILFPEMAVRVYNPFVLKRFQTAQFKRCLYITRRNPVLIYAYIQQLELSGTIVMNDNQFTVILCT